MAASTASVALTRAGSGSAPGRIEFSAPAAAAVFMKPRRFILAEPLRLAGRLFAPPARRKTPALQGESPPGYRAAACRASRFAAPSPELRPRPVDRKAGESWSGAR